jgi:hypothetical protein
MQKNDWFQHIIGFSESSWNLSTTSLPKIVTDNMGKFREARISDLEDLTNMKKHTDHPLLIVATRNDNKNDQKFDTSALQFNGPEHAMYQVASNFNCMELGSQYASPFSGHYLTHLMSDCTQGPSAAAGAGFGAILRVTIHNTEKIDLLRYTTLKHQNGKLKEYGDENGFDKKNPFDISSVCVGIHTDVRATFNRSRGPFEYNLDGPLIDQVYTSTCICYNSEPNKLSKLLLQAAYEGTYLAAVHRQSPKLVLTLIGGGCFRNSEQQIAEAIAEAHNKYASYLHPRCEVILPIYDRYYETILDTLTANTKVEHIKY